MWIHKDVIGWFTSLRQDADLHAEVLKEALVALREELAAVRAERDALKLQAAIDRANTDWIRAKINSLEFERAALIEKAYNITLPVPELIRTQHSQASLAQALPQEFNFDDIGDDVAKALGLPLHSLAKGLA